MNHLRDHKSAAYCQLILSGALNHYLADLNEHEQERLDMIVRHMTTAEGVDERMKASDQMEWVRRMKSIRNRAKEFILSDFVFR